MIGIASVSGFDLSGFDLMPSGLTAAGSKISIRI